ncbi:MAG: hypothetical protein KAI66_21650 [Lentisphaeria bacterium]|nr:hypothetical protein [Lentisphaeria bacterium]
MPFGYRPGTVLLAIPAGVRIPVTVVCFSIAGVIIGLPLVAGKSGTVVAFAFLMALPFLLVGFLFLLPTLAGVCGEALAGLIVPNRRFSRPQVMYGPIEALRLENAFGEAMSELEDVVAEYPDECRAYTLMMEIASTDLHDPECVERIYEHAREHIRGREPRERIDRAYSFYGG